MSQFNEIYDLKGINIFSDIPDMDTSMESNTTHIEQDLQYSAYIYINPSNRLFTTADIVGFREVLFNAVTVTSPIREVSYRASVAINASNDLFIKFSIFGSYDNYYMARVKTWDDRELLYMAHITIPVPEERPVLTYKSTFTNIRSPDMLYYTSNITISPRANMKLDYSLATGVFDSYKAHVAIGKEYEYSYKARFVINPTNRLICIGNVYGYDEYTYPATVNIKASGGISYAAVVRISLGSHIFVKLDVIDTPKHYFYGDLNKDSHTIETNPLSNYGGDRSLFLNDKSTLFLEWDFGWNLDTFYKPDLESGSGLRIHLKKALPYKSKGKIYLVKEQWEEYGITHVNKPKDLEFIREFDIPRNYVGRLDILLGDLLKNIQKTDDSFKISLAIEVDSPIDTYSNSRETNIDIPALFYEYYYVPPNLRQEVFGATINIKKAYGIDDEAWSGPAKMFMATVNRAPTQPTCFYNATINIKTSYVGYEDMPSSYNAFVFIENIHNRSTLYSMFMNIPIINEDILYQASLYIPERILDVYPATFEYVKTLIDTHYMMNVNSIKAYGKGSGYREKYPALGKERKWSGSAPHWKASFGLLTNSDQGEYMASVTMVRAYGKGNGRYQTYPALGAQSPWSKPAPHWRAIYSITRNIIDIKYMATFFNNNTIERPYKAITKTPIYNTTDEYCAFVHVLEVINIPYISNITIPIWEKEHPYKAIYTAIALREEEYPAVVYILGDAVRVQIFIM